MGYQILQRWDRDIPYMHARGLHNLSSFNSLLHSFAPSTWENQKRYLRVTQSTVAVCWAMHNCKQCSTLSRVCASSIRVCGGFSFNEPVTADVTGSCSTSRSVIPTTSWSSGIWISLRICSASFEPANKGSRPWHKTFKTSYVHLKVNLLRRLHTLFFCHTKCYSCFYNSHCPL